MKGPAGDFLELPAPTPWPLVAALGVALLFAGLVTHWLVSVVGFILAVRGGLGWWHDVLPVPQVERLALRPVAERAQPIQRARATAEHLVPGAASHRVRIPAEIHPYSAGITGGLAGGFAMAMLAELYGILATGSPWYPINLLAAIAMPSMAQAGMPQLMAFSSTGLVVATITHGLISLFVGLVYAAVLPMFPRHPAFLGGLLAPLLWSALLWATLDLINPALNQQINWRWFVASQMAFGLTAGFIIARTQKISTMQTWPLAARAGMEAPGLSEERHE